MRPPTWVALAVTGLQFILIGIAVMRKDAELAMIGGMLTPVTLGAVAYAIVSRRGRR